MFPYSLVIRTVDSLGQPRPMGLIIKLITTVQSRVLLYKNTFLCKKCYYIMFLAILAQNNYLNGAKLSQNIFHFKKHCHFLQTSSIHKITSHFCWQFIL